MTFSTKNVSKILDQDFYGSEDLVEMGIFKSNSDVHNKIRDNKITPMRVNKATLFFKKDQVIEYCIKYLAQSEEPIDFELNENEYNKLTELLSSKFNSKKVKATDFFGNCITLLWDLILSGTKKEIAYEQFFEPRLTTQA